MADEGGGGDSLAGDAVDEVGSWVAAALAVDFGLEPVAQGLKLAAGEGGFEVAEFHCSLIEELRGIEVAERVGREVAEEAGAPVDVLQDAAGVGGRLDAEVLAVFFVPGGGEIGDAELVVEEGLLEFETHEDVEVVGDFVGFGTDERGADVVDREIEVALRHVGERFAEGGLCEGIEVLPETAAATDEVFPHARLRFVDAERDGFAGGEAVGVFGEALIVDAVARFVEDAEEAAGEFVFVVAGGEAGVVRADAAAEGMMGDVEAAGLEVEADGGGGLPAE